MMKSWTGLMMPARRSTGPARFRLLDVEVVHQVLDGVLDHLDGLRAGGRRCLDSDFRATRAAHGCTGRAAGVQCAEVAVVAH